MPVTRFKVTDELVGWMKRVCSSAPMEKLCQLMMALSVDWVTVSSVPSSVMVALPAATVPPWGVARATVCHWARARAPTRALRRSAVRFPRARANSATAMKARRVSFQTRR